MNLKEKVRAIISSTGILTHDEINLIVEETIVDSFKKGTLLLKEGQIPTKCYMVVEGCVREYLLVDDEEKTTFFYTEGDKIAAYTQGGKDKPSKHYWECTEDCVLTISDKDFEGELRKLIPRLDVIIQDVAKEKLNKAKEEWSLFVSSSPEERYTQLMEKRPSLFNRLPHHQIASFLGMKPQSLSRIRKRVFGKQKEG